MCTKRNTGEGVGVRDGHVFRARLGSRVVVIKWWLGEGEGEQLATSRCIVAFWGRHLHHEAEWLSWLDRGSDQVASTPFATCYKPDM